MRGHAAEWTFKWCSDFMLIWCGRKARIANYLMMFWYYGQLWIVCRCSSILVLQHFGSFDFRYICGASYYRIGFTAFLIVFSTHCTEHPTPILVSRYFCCLAAFSKPLISPIVLRAFRRSWRIAKNDLSFGYVYDILEGFRTHWTKPIICKHYFTTLNY